METDTIQHIQKMVQEYKERDGHDKAFLTSWGSEAYHIFQDILNHMEEE